MRTLPVIELALILLNYFVSKLGGGFPHRQTNTHTLRQSSLCRLDCVHHNSDSSYPHLYRTVPGHYSSSATPPPHPPHLQPPEQYTTLFLHGISFNRVRFNVIFDCQQRDLSNCSVRKWLTVWEDVTYLRQKMTSDWKKEIIKTNGEMAHTRGRWRSDRGDLGWDSAAFSTEIMTRSRGLAWETAASGSEGREQTKKPNNNKSKGVNECDKKNYYKNKQKVSSKATQPKGNSVNVRGPNIAASAPLPKHTPRLVNRACVRLWHAGCCVRHSCTPYFQHDWFPQSPPEPHRFQSSSLGQH